MFAALAAGIAPSASFGQALTDQQLLDAGGITASASTDDAGPIGLIPVQRGLNGSLTTSSQHDSSNGWSSVLTPNVAFRLNRHFSADAGTPIYAYIDVDANVGTKAKPVFAYESRHGAFGDTSLSFHADESLRFVEYDGTVSVGFPTGNTKYGLGAGQTTFNINNHLEKSVWLITPDIELGYGDTSALVERRLKKSYVAVGPLAHFQAGASFDLPHRMEFESEAYEELPLASDTIYSTTGKGKKRVRTTTNRGPAEDNGFLTSLDIPLARHVTLSGFYDRSLRDRDDVAGFSFTFLLRPPPRLPDIVE